MFEVGYTFGWRSGELLDLRVRQADLPSNTLSLDPGTTKNKEGRSVVMTHAVRELIAASIYGKKPNDHVFTRKGEASEGVSRRLERRLPPCGLRTDRLPRVRRGGE